MKNSWTDEFGEFKSVFALLARFFTRHDLIILAIASIAWALRALAVAVLFPLAIGNIVNYLTSVSEGLPVTAFLLLISFTIIHVATEWAFLPYNYMFARKISDIRIHLANSINAATGESHNSASDEKKNLIGRIASDVDFFMGNVNGSIGTVVPNFFTAIFAMVTIANANQILAGVGLLFLLPYLLFFRKYSEKVFAVRMEERKIFANIIRLSAEAINGKARDEEFGGNLETWNKANFKLTFIDRAYLSAHLLIVGLGPIVLLLFGVYLVNQNQFNIGDLVTVLLAASNLYGAFGSMIWGFGILSQTVPPAKRIEETLIASI